MSASQLPAVTSNAAICAAEIFAPPVTLRALKVSVEDGAASCIAATSRAVKASARTLCPAGSASPAPAATSPMRSDSSLPSWIVPVRSHFAALTDFTASAPLIAPTFTRPSPAFTTAIVSTLVASVPASTIAATGPFPSRSGSSSVTVAVPGPFNFTVYVSPSESVKFCAGAAKRTLGAKANANKRPGRKRHRLRKDARSFIGAPLRKGLRRERAEWALRRQSPFRRRELRGCD